MSDRERPDPEVRPGRRFSSRPLCGAFYRLPTPGGNGLPWGIVACDDAGLDPDAGHSELWPAVIDRLAVAWGKNARALRERLLDRYAGLPRGRVTRPGMSSMILHGGDGPVAGWRAVVVGRFRLEGHRVKVLFDEHERMLAGDPEAVEDALGFRLGLHGVGSRGDWAVTRRRRKRSFRASTRRGT